MARLINNLIQVPSYIPVREPVYLIRRDKIIAFNAIKDNGNGFDLLMEYHPYSLFIDGLKLTEDAKRICDGLWVTEK